jgi:hypothetical protein
MTGAGIAHEQGGKKMKKMSGVLLAVVFAVWGFAGAAQAAIYNGDFSAGLDYWTKTGTVTVVSGVAIIDKNSSLYQSIFWSAGDVLSFDYWLDDNKNGKVSLDSVSIPSLPAASGIYQYTFAAAGSGKLLFSQGGKGAFSLDNVTLTASAVPLPGSLLLFGSGLLGLWGIGSRRNKAQLA